jgi:hypothetical protein
MSTRMTNLIFYKMITLASATFGELTGYALITLCALVGCGIFLGILEYGWPWKKNK